MECDYLIVGVTSDELSMSAKNKKPVIPFQERMEIDSLTLNDNNKLDEEVHIDSNRFKELADHPSLQTSFQKILNKVKKS